MRRALGRKAVLALDHYLALRCCFGVGHGASRPGFPRFVQTPHGRRCPFLRRGVCLFVRCEPRANTLGFALDVELSQLERLASLNKPLTLGIELRKRALCPL